MTDFDPLRIYRRMVATDHGGVVNWWYSGWTFVQLDDEPLIPLMQVTAVMTFRTEALDAEHFRIHWSEIGMFRDPRTGEPPGRWVNPVTGAIVEPPRGFSEGPGTWTLSRNAGGIALTIEQPHATVRGTEVRLVRTGSRFRILQHERKLRGFPGPDGKLPAADSGSSFEGITELAWYADGNDLSTATPRVEGVYSFTLSGIPPWMGFGSLPGRAITRGRIARAGLDDRLDRISWDRLVALYPDASRLPPALRR